MVPVRKSLSALFVRGSEHFSLLLCPGLDSPCRAVHWQNGHAQRPPAGYTDSENALMRGSPG